MTVVWYSIFISRGEGAAIGGIGVGIGVFLALGTTRLLNKLLFGINAIDPLTFGITCALILVIALLASYIPALKASNIDPVEALRQQ